VVWSANKEDSVSEGHHWRLSTRQDCRAQKSESH